MARYTCLFILLFHFYVLVKTNGSRNTKFRRSLHFAPHLRDELSSPRMVAIIQGNQLKQKDIPAFLNDYNPIRSRHKRTASSSDQHEPVNTVFAFNDSHTQMVVHWAGKQSDVIICLTKGHNLASGQRSEHSSHVYVSKNYGENFTRIDDKLTLSNGSHALIAQYFTSPVFNTHYLFADETNQLIFTTQNYGDTITRFYVPFKPKKIVFHKMHPDYALGMDDSDTVNRILYLTRNFGSTWHEIQRDVKSFYWEDEKYVDNQYSNTNHSFCVYVHRLTYNDKGTVIRSCDFFITETIALLNDVHDFEIQHQYMFATKKVRLLGGTGYTHQIWVSNYRGPFYNAEFPHDLTHLDYYIADTSEDQVLMCVNHETSSSHLYVSNVNGTKFSLSLEDILYYNPNGSYGQTWLRYYEDESFADLHKVEGMRGVYIASQLINKTLALDHQRSLITFDKGGEWQLVIAPKLDANKRPTNCSAERDAFSTSRERRHCSLHLSQEFNRVASTYRPRSILSRKSAPGMIIATGNTGDKIHLDEMAGIYMSTDAGWSWQHVLDGMHIFAIADQGGLLVAVIGYIPTNEVVYSTDDGETWKTYKFTDTPIRIHGLLTEPGETTTVLFLFGSNVEQHSWKVISLNMSSIFPYKCREADYKQWSLEDDTSFQGCMLGRKTVYERRISRINCYNGGEYQREIRSETCPCRREDFECDFGYQPNDRFGRTHCVQSPDFDNTEVHAIPENCPIGSFYPYTRGYQKVAGDTCKGGQEHLYAPLNYACPVRDDLSEFIVYTQTETIKRHLFETSQDETLVNEHEAEEIVSVDFAYSDNCLYWADNSNKKIQRLCEDGHHQIEDLHNTSIGQIASIAFDWKGNNIYWIDKEFKTLEVSKKNGRFRRELLRGSQYFDRPLYLLLDPHHGWMYWSDESSSNPRIMKAWMDGLNTSITTVVSGSDNVRRPAGLAIDYETEVLYWTDTMFHRIVAYDLQTNITTILVSGYSNAPYPYAIGVVQNSIYWTDYMKNSILTADKFTGSGITSIDTNLEGVMDLKIMHRFSQSGGIKACQKDARHCSQLCLLKPGVDNNHGDNRTCRCADNSTRTVFSLGGDETCCFKGKADANGTCIASNGTCDDKHFECTSGRCIPGHWHCDGDNDCGDMSDETNCPYQACTSTQFECNNGRCIVGSWRCDLDDDCHDNSDEEGCTYPACTDDQFRCNNSRCINKAWVCDRDNDCRDDSDEQNCNATVIPCENYEFHCATGWPRCVPNYRVCNGYENCADGSDERNCTGCAAGQFQCDNGNCTRLYWKCDGYDDCGDNSDEINCTTTTPYTSTTHVYTRPYTCRWNQFRCNNGFCIDNRDRCDSLDDCGDYSDEINCGHRTCSPYQFACASGDQCLFRYQHCDGIPQCQDSSDEWYCATTPWPRQCGEMEYRCWNSSNHECIPAASRCDGSRDCNNAEDESGCGGGLSCDPKRMFKCRQSAGCILRRDVCNEKIDCPDGSDEIGCQTSNTTGHTNYTSCTGSHMFHCKFQDKCIPYMFTCDGMPDCYHSSDENLWQCRDIRFTTRNFLKVSEIGKNNFTVEWGAVDGHVTYIFSYIYQGHGGYQGANVTGLNVTHHTVKSLHPAHKYYVVVYVSNSTYIWQPYRRINITTLDDYPDQPIEVTAHYDRTTKLLKVSWYQPSVFKGSIRKYRIYVKEVGSIYYLYQDVYSEKNPVFSATLDSEILQLVFGRNYSIVMSAFTMEGEGKKTEPIFVVYAPQCSLSYVGNLTAVGKNNSILLRWNPSGAQVDSYKVVYWDLWNVKREMHTKDGKTTSLLVDNLCSDTVYSFGVVPEKQGCLGDFLYIGAKTNGTKVGIPVVKVDLLDRTKINVSWTPPKGAIPKENYTIFYDYRPEDLHTSAVETHAESLTTSMTFIIVDQLQACDLYTFRVAATGAGRCHLSDGVSQRTAFDVTAPPEEVEVVAIDRTTVNVTWHSSCSVKSEAVGYIITKKEIYGKGTVEVDNPYKFTNRTKMNMTYYNLIPGATYNFTVSTNAKFARSSKPVSISIEGYDAPTDLSQIPTTWNFDSGHLSWKGNRMQVPKTKFKGYQVLLCTIAKLKFNNTCPDEKFKPYGIVQNEFIEFKNLKKGRQYIFAVRVNMINGYYGKMGKFPVFTVPDEENVHRPSETVTLSKTNIIAIAASGVAVVVALGVILAFFIVRHKRLQRSFRAFASSHYDSRSGTTTFTAADELGEDEESPMIRGFSDDEPLVIA